jgi:hypothetical protein
MGQEAGGPLTCIDNLELSGQPGSCSLSGMIRLVDLKTFPQLFISFSCSPAIWKSSGLILRQSPLGSNMEGSHWSQPHLSISSCLGVRNSLSKAHKWIV